MSSMIIESAANANMTKESAVSANEAVELGSKRVRDTISGISKIAEIILHTSEQMNQLEERSKKIGEVVDVIDDIADQTNLLALNANIEAARAGEAGRGFAVVADEVRKLAEKTVTATSEISTAIKLIQDDVRLAVKAMKTIEENSSAGQELATQSENALLQISDSILAVTEAIKQIAAATDEQSSGANQISKTIVNISSVSKQAASAAQLLANSSKELSNEVSALNNHIDQFQV
ncbi:MAG: methyl-accepting chemotaxis protein, partial [Flavobacteriales bacterium]